MSTAPSTPSPHAEDFGWSLGVLLRAYQSSVTGALGELPHGHRGFEILSAVVHGDQPSQLALAAHLGIDRSVMTYLIDDLVDAGLVERRPNANDRRQRKVVATDAGARTLANLERRVEEARDDVLSTLSREERDTLCSLVRRIALDTRDIDTRTDPCDVAQGVRGARVSSAER